MTILWRLARSAWNHKWYLLAAYVAMTASTLSALLIPRLMGTAVDEALESGLRSQLLLLGGAIVMIAVLRGVFRYAESYLSEVVSQRAAFDIRNAIFRKLQSLSFGFHDHEQTGNLMSKATADVEAVRRFWSMGLIRGLSTLLMLGAVAAIMITANWRLGIITFAFIPVLLWRAVTMAKGLRVTWMRVQTETGLMTTVLQENLAGIRVVKSFGTREHEEQKFHEKAIAVADQTYSATRQMASQGSLMIFIFTLATGAILWFGGREAAAGRLTEGELASFLLYLALLAMPIRMFGGIVNTFSRAASAGQRIFDVLDAESPVQEKPDARPLRSVSGRVEFENVSFSYDSKAPAVRNLDFTIEPGQLVAILGAPGSGKSTIVHLLPRFYDVTAGRLTIDGTDIRDVTLASLRSNVGIVQQDVFVFGATLRDNIAYGARDSSLEDVVQAAQVAQLHDYIESLPNKYDSWVGERGITLSGGQRQRLAIARTILLDPPILILDDSTSSVDVGTEYMIQEALAEVVKGRTTFVIAHRLSTVRMADLILVMEQGEIAERGTHSQLMELDGYYRGIYDLQLRPQAEEAIAAPTAATGGDA